MWKTLVVTPTGKQSQRSIKYTQFTPTSIENINNQQDENQKRVTTMSSNSFCHKYFKSIQKKRHDASRISSHSKDKSESHNVIMEALKSSRSPKQLKTQANDSMIANDHATNQFLFRSTAEHKQADSPLRFKEMIKQIESQRVNYPLKHYKLKQVKKRIDNVHKDFKITKDSIMKQILLFKNLMNKTQAQISQLDLNSTNDKNQIQNTKTECTLGPISPSKNVLGNINDQIRKYQKSMNDLQKRKQQLISRIKLNEKKIKQ